LVGGVIGKGLGTIINKAAGEFTKETARLGKKAAKEIAKEGYKTALARALISKGQ
jgi:hypothetical protein